MPLYTYKATDQDDNLVTGTMTARSRKEVEATLKDRKLKFLAAKEKSTSGPLFAGSMPVQEKVSLCRYLALIINSGVPISEGLDLLVAGMGTKTSKRVIEDITGSIRRGESLHSAFSRYPQHFSSVFLAMVKTGETAGTLADSFIHLGKQFEEEKELKSKVMSALLYPFIIVLLMGGVGTVMFTFVLPRLANVFTRLNLTLPLYTRLLFSTSLFMQKHMIVVGASLVGIIVIFVLFIKSSWGRRLGMMIILHTPYVRNILLEYNLVRFTQSLSALLKSGVSVTEAIELSLQALSVVKTEKVIKSFQEKITRGRDLSDVFAESKLFPPLMVQLVKIGEKTGNLEKTLTDLSVFYQDEVEKSLKGFVTVLEPTLLIIVGIGVGVMVVSVISPIYSLIGQLQSGM